jgi:hypothetical protein
MGVLSVTEESDNAQQWKEQSKGGTKKSVDGDENEKIRELKAAKRQALRLLRKPTPKD